MSKFEFSKALGLAQLSPDDLFEHIEEAITIGSFRSLLSWNDFEFKVNNDADLNSIKDISAAIEHGMQYLDAVYYFNAPDKPANITIRKRKKGEDFNTTPKNIAIGIFSWFFSIYSQGRAIAQGSNNFLSQVLGLGQDWANHVRNLSSVNMELIPKDWVINVTFEDLSEPSRNRLALGAGGHRWIQCLTYLKESDFKDNTENHQIFVKVILEWSKGTVWWDLHPVTKSGNVISVTRSLNKKISDCLYHCLTDECKARLASSKILFEAPRSEPAHADWERLNIENLPKLTQPIF